MILPSLPLPLISAGFFGAVIGRMLEFVALRVRRSDQGMAPSLSPDLRAQTVALHRRLTVLAREFQRLAELARQGRLRVYPDRASPQSRADAAGRGDTTDGDNAARRPDGDDAGRRPDGDDAGRGPDGDDAARRPDGDDAGRRPDGDDAGRRRDGDDAGRRPDGDDARRGAGHAAPAPDAGFGQPPAVAQGPALPAAPTRGFGWMLGFVPAEYGPALAAMLRNPEMVALIQASPAVARLLRPLCRGLGVEPPEGVFPPPRRRASRRRPGASRAPRRAAAAPVASPQARDRWWAERRAAGRLAAGALASPTRAAVPPRGRCAKC